MNTYVVARLVKEIRRLESSAIVRTLRGGVIFDGEEKKEQQRICSKVYLGFEDIEQRRYNKGKVDRPSVRIVKAGKFSS